MRTPSRHTCIDVLHAKTLSIEEIYTKAGTCPLCVELGDFIARKRGHTSSPNNNTSAQLPITKDTLDKLLDSQDLYAKGCVLTTFSEVIANTISRLKPHQAMTLYSTGELLEARHPYAFSEVISAIRRGVNLEYVISELPQNRRDIDLLKTNLSYVVEDKQLRSQLRVTYTNALDSNIKQVHYFNEERTILNGLVEVSFCPPRPYEGTRRLWVKLEESERERFITALDKHAGA